MSDMNPNQRPTKVGAIWWEPHGHNQYSRGYDGPAGANEVASITKLANHRHNPKNEDIYELKVLGERVIFRSINEAQKKASELHSVRPR
jgi:hypothetical protein